MPSPSSPKVHSTHLSPTHTFTKSPSPLLLIPNHGILHNCHAGPTVQHRSRLHIHPPPLNLRQVHLLSLETLQEPDIDVPPGALGENITMRGLDLHGLRKGVRLHFLPSNKDEEKREKREKEEEEEEEEEGHAVVCIQGLRNPCHQIDKYRKGLQEKFVVRDPETRKIIQRRAGVMGTVEVGGEVRVGMRIRVEEPVEGEGAGEELECV
ncbi:MAG: hypothetical protein Q9227_008446 [Pyrenula ochraceoflavens]